MNMPDRFFFRKYTDLIKRKGKAGGEKEGGQEGPP